MQSTGGQNSSYFDDGYDATDWDDFGPDSNINTRNDRYSNAYGGYRGGYGPMNSGGGGHHSLNQPPLGFGPINDVGYGQMNRAVFSQYNFMRPGPKPLFATEEVNYLMGRGYGPQGPVRQRRFNDKTIKFLLRCGVPKENVKNLPKSLLELIAEDNCGLCGQSFNTFAIARIHYISKNHFKNQKKWLSQHTEGGLQANTEIPFKSRELYCEICDVHITSKAHADSHYAGRPHRAIVEGRKMPRNPILLQANMATRLEQLIRREKKNLKPVEGEDDKQQGSGTESKIVQSELYCEICKTSVTCTEQMTMHLNGKRHLGKEKQHILRMMKGESKDAGKKKKNVSAIENKTVAGEGEDVEGEDVEGEGVEGEDVEGEDVEGEDVGGEEGNRERPGEEGAEDRQKGEDDYDWGNGSGNWDEPETQ